MQKEGFQIYATEDTKITPFQICNKKSDKNKENKEIKRKLDDFKLGNTIPDHAKDNNHIRITEKERIKREVEHFKFQNDFRSKTRADMRLKPAKIYSNYSFPPPNTVQMYRTSSFPH